MTSTCSEVNLFRIFVTVKPTHEKALSDGAEKAGTKVRLLMTNTRHAAMRLPLQIILACD